MKFTPKEVGRFWAKVDRRGRDECWPWLASQNGNGYGQFWISVGTRGAHRISYELEVGPIPEGLTIDHLCRNRACVNPAHLEPVTRGENVLRGESLPAQNATKTNCTHGHPFDVENTHVDPCGYRVCRACKRDTWRKLQKRSAA